jgi:hypothetical protein
MKNLKLIFLLLFSISANSQEINYKELVDDPYEMKNLSIQLFPAYTSVTTGKKVDYLEEDATVPVGWAIGIKLSPIPVLNKKIGFNMKYMRSYLEIPQKLDKDGEKIRMTYFELGGTFNFFNKEKIIDQDLELSRRSNGTSTTVKYLRDVPMTRVTQFDLAGGIYRVKSPIDIGPVTSIVKALGFYGGIRFTQKVNYKALVSGYGVKNSATRNSWYINVLYTPTVNYTDGNSIFGGAIFETKKQMDSLNMINKFGVIAGYEFEFFPHKSISVTVPFELGIKPPFNGYYIYIGFAMSINLDFMPKFLTKK